VVMRTMAIALIATLLFAVGRMASKGMPKKKSQLPVGGRAAPD